MRVSPFISLNMLCHVTLNLKVITNMIKNTISLKQEDEWKSDYEKCHIMF